VKRSWIYAAALGLVCLLVLRASWAMTYATFGRDPGIFQYVAWALSQGERAYVDFREINGPLPHLIHWAFLGLGGADEHRFRVLDVLLGSAVFLFVGRTLVASLLPPARVRPATVWACTLGTWAVLMGQYLSFGWWQTAQRESFYDLFLLASLAFQNLATRDAAEGERRSGWKAAAWLALAGLASSATWFGKPPCLVFTFLQIIALYMLPSPLSRRLRLLPFLGGVAVVGAYFAWFLHRYGDFRAAFTILVLENPRLYRFIWKRSLLDACVAWGNLPRLIASVSTVVLLGYLLWARRIARRALLLLVLPVGGLALFFVQSKGFPYHLHPVCAGVYLAWVALVADTRWLRTFGPWAVAHRPYVASALFAALGTLIVVHALDNEYVGRSSATEFTTQASRQERAYFKRFPWGDFFAWDLREAARYVQQETAPTDRVQTYGMDPYFLYLAQRLSATPYIYSFELNVDAALQGGSGGSPDEAERTWLKDTAARNEAAMLAALEARPPAAFVFFDKVPFTQPADGRADFERHCPTAYAWVVAHFAPSKDFGTAHVWLRKRPLTP